jgi:hypothetical protein
MDVDEAQARMREIQRIMERATLCTLLPGTAAVVGGLAVLAGCAVSFFMLQGLDLGAFVQLPSLARAELCGLWIAIGVGSVALNIVLTMQSAARTGIPALNRPAQVAAFSLTPSVVVAIVLTLKFLLAAPLRADDMQSIAPIWMMLYGTGVYTAGLFSIRPPRILGLAFLAAGIVALIALPGYGVAAIALSFGLLHIVFGIYVLQKQRRQEPQ